LSASWEGLIDASSYVNKPMEPNEYNERRNQPWIDIPENWQKCVDYTIEKKQESNFSTNSLPRK